MKITIQSNMLMLSLILVIFSVSSAFAQTTDDIKTVPYKSIGPRVESTIENTVIVTLRRISQARSDIHRKEFAKARHELNEAVWLIESIRDNLSTSVAKNLIRVARNHLEYENPQQVLKDFPSIYDSLNKASIYLPTDKAKKHLDRAKEYLTKNKKLDADRELDLANKALIVIEVEQPLLKSQQFVTKAQQYLAAKKTEKADEALKIAERYTMDLFSRENSALYQAKQNIWLAFSNYSTARHAEAKMYLEKARSNLSKVAAEGNAKAREEAEKLLTEVSELEKKLTDEGKVAESAFKAAWEKGKALAERSAAYVSAGLSEAETTLGSESNLIEARLHTAYAETYQVTTQEPDKSARELDTAYSYVQKAAESSLAGPSDRKKIHDIGKLLLNLKASQGKDDSATQERFNTVNEKLNELIQKM
ncbi:YfdX family protein [Geobacter pelophilus]|uniref:YfdX family protein n=1 Tax=Geoanaerobacter pelophilus TaxID=60036 RepID=A0AAW4L667_9BACT|nr:YfdX family protein [Geoanaerobacter pelophilus]MBT0666496.1 YfdX family protein [Geoanaerobacter pelophilus]